MEENSQDNNPINSGNNELNITPGNFPSSSNEENKKNKKSGLFSFFKKGEKKSEEKATPQENAFTQVFKKKEGDKKDDASLIDTIIKSAQEKEVAEKEKTEKLKVKQEEDIAKDIFDGIEEEEEEEEGGVKQLTKIAKITFFLSLLAPLISYGVAIFFLSTDNFFINYFNIKNIGKEFAFQEQFLSSEKDEINKMKDETKKIEKKIESISNNKILEEILSKRIDWLQVIAKIEKVANKIFHNDVTHIATFTNYSGKSSESQLTVTGFVKDPSGRSFARLADLITELNAHENFSGAEVRSFTKSEDEDKNARSNFNLTFDYTRQEILKASAEEKEKNKEKNKK